MDIHLQRVEAEELLNGVDGKLDKKTEQRAEIRKLIKEKKEVSTGLKVICDVIVISFFFDVRLKIMLVIFLGFRNYTKVAGADGKRGKYLV